MADHAQNKNINESTARLFAGISGQTGFLCFALISLMKPWRFLPCIV